VLLLNVQYQFAAIRRGQEMDADKKLEASVWPGICRSGEVVYARAGFS